MKPDMYFGIVRDRETGETFDIAVPAASLDVARQKLAQTPNLELILDREAGSAVVPPLAPWPADATLLPSSTP